MKRVISIILTAALTISTAAMPAQAKTWIKVSSWAYNDVSNFKSEGLVPEAMEDAEDYTQDITRIQFAEIVYSVLSRTQSLSSTRGRDSMYAFGDVQSRAAEALNLEGIMTGELNEKGKEYYGYDYVDYEQSQYGMYQSESGYYNFFPDRLLTREEMAAILCRAASSCLYIVNVNEGTPQKEPKDAKDISDWARDDVCIMLGAGLLSGTDDGRFMPKSHLTIEQAVVAVYNMYKNIPNAPETDGEGLTGDSEQPVQTYTNGITETRKGNVLYLKDGGKTLMEFETDIYSNIYCITIDKVIYAIAQKANGKTDVYNADTKEKLFKIPHPVKSSEPDGIYTKSNNIGPMTFGLYDYSGKELLEPKYSMEEIDIIRQNGFKIPEDKYQAPSGWIYYIDFGDNNHLYKMDSNGESKQKISNKKISSFYYLNDRIFYWDIDRKLYCMEPDGKNDQLISDGNSYYISDIYYYKYSVRDKTSLLGYDREYVLSGRDRYVDNNGQIYYIQYTDKGDNNWTQELYRISMEDDKIINEKIAPELNHTTEMQVKDEKVYFKDETVENAQSDDLYCFNGEKVTKVAADITEFGFYEDKLVIIRGTYDSDDENRPVYLADLDGSHEEIWQEVVDAEKAYKEKYGENGEGGPESDTFTDIWDGVSDDEFTIFEITSYTTNKQGERDYVYELYARDKDGRESLIMDSRKMGYIPNINRIGNKLYYRLERRRISDGHLIVYDMETGESREIADNVYELTARNYDITGSDIAGGKNWFMYRDLDRNTWRYDTDTDTKTEIFPNASIRKYGKVEQMLGTNTGMYKVDTDGNISFIMDDWAANCTYVENGASEGVRF